MKGNLWAGRYDPTYILSVSAFMTLWAMQKVKEMSVRIK